MSPGADPDHHVRARMYNVGFGDCFLFILPLAGRKRTILVDCASTNVRRSNGRAAADRLFEDLQDELHELRIDIVIATHRHRDHIGGFENPRFRDVHVGEVWLPWTEHPTDPAAVRIREGQSRFATALHEQLTRPGVAADPRWVALAANALPNAEAMRTLQQGFAGGQAVRRRFLSSANPIRGSFKSSKLPGVRVHVLGPSTNPRTIFLDDPPEGEHYLQEDAGQTTRGILSPFGAILSPQQYQKLGGGALPPPIRTTAESALKDEAGLAAVKLEAALNGTSLMLMLEVGDLHMLLPGDAEWGTWKEAMEDPRRRDLLRRTNFYKIGHHGSFNATPRDFIQDILPREGAHRFAMTSVAPRANWPEIPKPEVLDALQAHQFLVARSDQPLAAPPSFVRGPEGTWLEAWLPTS